MVEQLFVSAHVTKHFSTKVALILDSSRTFPREHLKFKPLTSVYVSVVRQKMGKHSGQIGRKQPKMGTR
jgi:hypothetical protein